MSEYVIDTTGPIVITLPIDPQQTIDRLTEENEGLNKELFEAIAAIQQWKDEADRMREELAQAFPQTECGDCGNILQLVRPGKHQCNYCEMKEFYSTQLKRYRAELERMLTVESRCYGDCHGYGECQKIAREALDG